MKITSPLLRSQPRPVLLALSLALLWVGAPSCSAGGGKPATPAIAAGDPWTAAQLMRPAELARLLKDSKAEKPLLLHVGFKVLYHAGAIPGSRYVGPGQKPEGIAALQAAVQDLPRERSIVIYCGCCPWDHCPNMKPAFQALRDLGFKNARALYVTKNLETDWAGKGYPLETPKD